MNNQLKPMHVCLLCANTSERAATRWLKQEGCLLRINPVFSRASFQLGHECGWWLEGLDLDSLGLIEVISLAAARAWHAEGRAVF